MAPDSMNRVSPAKLHQMVAQLSTDVSDVRRILAPSEWEPRGFADLIKECAVDPSQAMSDAEHRRVSHILKRHESHANKTQTKPWLSALHCTKEQQRHLAYLFRKIGDLRIQLPTAVELSLVDLYPLREFEDSPNHLTHTAVLRLVERLRDIAISRSSQAAVEATAVDAGGGEPPTGSKVGVHEAEALDGNSLKILEALRKKKGALILSDLAIAAELSERTCRERAKWLCAQGFVRRLKARQGIAITAAGRAMFE